jgi:hypothetical protein
MRQSAIDALPAATAAARGLEFQSAFAATQLHGRSHWISRDAMRVRSALPIVVN